MDEIEMLSSGFASKIWQKITLIDRYRTHGVSAAMAPALAPAKQA